MNTEHDQDSGGPMRAGGSLSRRAVVRTAANSAWAVPVVMIATTAPAFAASAASSLSITTYAAGYSGQGAAGVRPDLLTFSVTIANSAATATTGLSFEFLVPKGTARFGTGNLYDSVPVVTGGAGWSNVIAAIVDPTYSHKVTFTRTGAQIPGGGNLTLSDAVIQFSPGSPEPSPYKPWVGSAYTVGGVAKATNAPAAASSTAPVAESSNGVSTNTALRINALNATKAVGQAALTVAVGVGGAAANGAVTNNGIKTCGPITLQIVVPFINGHRFYGQAPVTTTATAPAGWSGGARTGSGPWTYTFTVASPPVAYANLAAGNPAAEANTPDFATTTFTLTDAVSGTTGAGITTANAIASFGAGTATNSDGL